MAVIRKTTIIHTHTRWTQDTEVGPHEHISFPVCHNQLNTTHTHGFIHPAAAPGLLFRGGMLRSFLVQGGAKVVPRERNIYLFQNYGGRLRAEGS